MSVHDVAAVDRVGSLRRTPAPSRPSKDLKIKSPSSSIMTSSNNISLPTSPTRDNKPNSDTLRRAMARHQASLSRPESPKNLNDDLPQLGSGNVANANVANASLYARSGSLLKSGHNLHSPSSGAGVRRRERDYNHNPRYRMVSSTGYKSIPSTGNRSTKDYTPGLEEAKSSLRKSQILLDEVNYDVKSLPRMENLSGSSGDDLPELSTKKYPYLSNTTYSLPRNHRVHHIQKSNRQFASQLRESQESLMSSSREYLLPESRESLLNRYPASPRTPRRLHPDEDHAYPTSHSTSSRHSSPVHDDPRHHPGYKLQQSLSTSHFPPEYYQQHNYDYHYEPHQHQHPYYHHQYARSSRGYYSDHYEGYYSDFDYRRSAPVSPSPSTRSSRAASPTHSFRSEKLDHHHSRRTGSPTNSVHSSRSRASPSQSRRSSRASSPHERPRLTDYYETQEYIRKASIRLHDITSPSGSRVSSRHSSARSSRATSPSSSRNENQLDNILMAARQQTAADSSSKIVYVRETFQVIPSSDCDQSSVTSDPNLPTIKDHNLVKINTEETQLTLGTPFPGARAKTIINKRSPTPSEDRMKVLDDQKIEVPEKRAVDHAFRSSKSDKSVMTDNEDEDRNSVITQGSTTSSKIDKGISVDLSRAGISNIEEMLESLSRRVRNVETMEKDLIDNDDSARAESVASMISSTSSKGREKKEDEVTEKEAHSMIRRQSVIIEGLTLETDELKRRCQQLEDEMANSAVDELQSKLLQVEGKLEETENYCYQVVEENVELKTEVENLESEISEVQDTFRDKDAKEFKKTKWELENLAKTCRNLQLKLGKAQAKASRLRQEKEEIEEQQRDVKLWKTTAVVAAAALAVVHLVNKYK